jgi:hypothetical protein
VGGRVVTVIGVVALAGCGGGDARPPGIPLGPTPAAVGRACAHVHAAMPVACPSRWPRGSSRMAPELEDLTRPKFRGYLLSLNQAGFRTSDFGHLILGGQPRPFALRGRTGADRRLGIIRAAVVRSAQVGAAPALVLRAPPYPRGGVHGGHVIVLWNRGGHGYLVSLHFAGGHARYSQAQRIDAALAIAGG